MPFCKECGNRIAKDDDFCLNCGAKHPRTTQPSSQPDTSAPLPVPFNVAIERFFTLYTKGRASRSEFWYPTLVAFLLGLAIVLWSLKDTPLFVNACIQGLLNYVQSYFFIAHTIVFIRRLRDLNLSGWWFLPLGIAPYILAFGLITSGMAQKEVAENQLDTLDESRSYYSSSYYGYENKRRPYSKRYQLKREVENGEMAVEIGVVIGIVGFLLWIVIGCCAGTPTVNRFGPPPHWAFDRSKHSPNDNVMEN